MVPVTVTVQGDGSVNGDSDGINCPADCTEEYKKYSLITLSATPGPDSVFVGWEGDCVGTQPDCKLKIRRSRHVTALFEKNAAADPADDSGPDLSAEPVIEITSPVVDEAGVTTDQTTVETIQIGWPVFSGS